ncbi:hypothetical protein NQ318_021402 [Aromia moschata]|uniref:Uncharacterized protein n=1 Tax=Aromia moschata TaxID=1265417 RepID=A0AAV8ZDS4_9CUCU|nr:hypothetical protein NQ318_021402 [Aromia moschata]
MWNMMCDVMPTISEDSISQRSSQFSGEDANFEQLMVSMLDERDKLMDSLRETQERLGETEIKLQETEKERDSLQRQIAANLPQVAALTIASETPPFGAGQTQPSNFVTLVTDNLHGELLVIVKITIETLKLSRL